MGNKLISFRYKLLSHVEAPRPRRLVRKKTLVFLQFGFWRCVNCVFEAAAAGSPKCRRRKN